MLAAYDQQFQTVNASDCTFPFTYNKVLYYQCAGTFIGTGDRSCDKFACIMRDGQLANCLDDAGEKLLTYSRRGTQ